MATLTFNVRTVEDMIKALECLPPKFDVGKLKIVAVTQILLLIQSGFVKREKEGEL